MPCAPVSSRPAFATLLCSSVSSQARSLGRLAGARRPAFATLLCSSVSSQARSLGRLAGARRPAFATLLCSSVSSQARSRTQLQCGLADADRLAGVDQQGALDALLIEVGAVGRAEVLDVPLAAAVGQPRMPGAGEVVGEDERGVVGPADQDRLVAERDLRSGEGAGGDHEGAR